jgi:hypothetical protein
MILVRQDHPSLIETQHFLTLPESAPHPLVENYLPVVLKGHIGDMHPQPTCNQDLVKNIQMRGFIKNTLKWYIEDVNINKFSSSLLSSAVLLESYFSLKFSTNF